MLKYRSRRDINSGENIYKQRVGNRVTTGTSEDPCSKSRDSRNASSMRVGRTLATADTTPEQRSIT
jgi:hypothetical protein